jgi:hypothetical protein
MTPFTSSTKETNMIKATSIALASAMLISNAALAIDGPPQPPPTTAPQRETENFWRWCAMKYQYVERAEDCRQDYTASAISNSEKATTEWWMLTQSTPTSLYYDSCVGGPTLPSPATQYDWFKTSEAASLGYSDPRIKEDGEQVTLFYRTNGNDGNGSRFVGIIYLRTKEACEKEVKEIAKRIAKRNAPPSLTDRFENWTERFKDWLNEKSDNWEQSKKDAEYRRLRKLYVECQASSATAVQASACYALKTGKY